MSTSILIAASLFSLVTEIEKESYSTRASSVSERGGEGGQRETDGELDRSSHIYTSVALIEMKATSKEG